MRKAVLWLSVLVAILFAHAAGPSVFGQSQTTGTINGTVVDQNGALIAGASVVIRNKATGITRNLTTNEAGSFSAPLLDPGDYEVTASANGFDSLTKQGTLALNQTLEANLVLTPSGVAGTVTVTSESELVQTTSPEVTTLVNQRDVNTLPLNGRRFHDLVFLTAGVSQDPERGGIVFAGQRGINSNFQIDGNDYNERFFGGLKGGERSNSAFTFSQAAIREFQVSRAGAAPEFGHSTAGVVNVISKSGGNAWHGSAFYYLRHREFSPRDMFGNDTAPTRQQFGGDFSGPIVKNRTFFYVNYDGSREKQPLIIRFNSTTGLPQSILERHQYLPCQGGPPDKRTDQLIGQIQSKQQHRVERYLHRKPNGHPQ
jgi:Carboxypeptidase regulatory-like domain